MLMTKALVIYCVNILVYLHQERKTHVITVLEAVKMSKEFLFLFTDNKLIMTGVVLHFHQLHHL